MTYTKVIVFDRNERCIDTLSLSTTEVDVAEDYVRRYHPGTPYVAWTDLDERDNEVTCIKLKA